MPLVKISLKVYKEKKKKKTFDLAGSTLLKVVLKKQNFHKLGSGKNKVLVVELSFGCKLEI